MAFACCLTPQAHPQPGTATVERSPKEQMKSNHRSWLGHRLSRCSALLDLTVNNPAVQKVKHVVEEDRPHAVACLLVRGWIILKVLNMGPHQMPKYVLGNLKQYNSQNCLSDVAEAQCWASRAHNWRIRHRRAWRELLGVASRHPDKRSPRVGGSWCEPSLRHGIFLRFAYWCKNVVRSNDSSSATAPAGEVERKENQ